MTSKRELLERIEELEQRVSELEPKIYTPFVPYSTTISDSTFTHRCMFDGLKPGVYGISCPCPKHSTWNMS